MSLDYSLSVDEVAPAWTPRVGDRVRIRLSAECKAFDLNMKFDGATGTVMAVEEDAWEDHCYEVDVDDEALWSQFFGRMYAITELEPLHDEVQP